MSPRLHADVKVTRTPDGAMLLDTRSGKFWHLNQSGAIIVEGLTAGDTVEELIDVLRHRFGISRDLAETDIGRITESLRAARLVTT